MQAHNIALTQTYSDMFGGGPGRAPTAEIADALEHSPESFSPAMLRAITDRLHELADLEE